MQAGRHAKTGEPLHADMTAFLLARGASPHEDGTSTAAKPNSRTLAGSRDHLRLAKPEQLRPRP